MPSKLLHCTYRSDQGASYREQEQPVYHRAWLPARAQSSRWQEAFGGRYMKIEGQDWRERRICGSLTYYWEWKHVKILPRYHKLFLRTSHHIKQPSAQRRAHVQYLPEYKILENPPSHSSAITWYRVQPSTFNMYQPPPCACQISPDIWLGSARKARVLCSSCCVANLEQLGCLSGCWNWYKTYFTALTETPISYILSSDHRWNVNGNLIGPPKE